MDMELQPVVLEGYRQVLDTAVTQEETLESIVPDACPDILRIVDVYGQATLSGKQAREDLAVVNGMVRVAILYQPEGGSGLRRMGKMLTRMGVFEKAPSPKQLIAALVSAFVRERSESRDDAYALEP